MRKIQLLVLLMLFFSTSITAQTQKIQGVPRTDVKGLIVKKMASDANFTFNDIQYWVGEGSKKAALVVQWNDGKNPVTLVWGYKFDGNKTGADMVIAISAEDGRFYHLARTGTQFGTGFGGFGFDADGAGTIALIKGGDTSNPLYPVNGQVTTSTYNFDDYKALDPNDRWESGWNTGYWGYYGKDGASVDYDYSGQGPSERPLENNSWDAWTYQANFDSYPLAETFTAVTPYVQPSTGFSNGVFFLNEDWFGHADSSLNFMKNDGTFTYNVFKAQNNDMTLGTSSAYAAIYGDQFFFVSKQPGAGDNHSGRLAVADASTLVRNANFDTIGGDGRSFVGVTAQKGYLATSKGIVIYDIANQQIKTAIAETDGTSNLYSGQIGNMIRTSKYVFAINQKKGLLVIDPTTDTVIKNVSGAFTRIVHSKDGNVWVATKNSLTKINPYTLAQDTPISLPTNAVVSADWGSWRAGSFSASTQNNTLYWINDPGSWSEGNTVVKYDIDTNTLNTSFFTLPQQDTTFKQIFYGAGLRVHPVTDELYLNATESGFGSHYEKNWVYVVSNTGTSLKTLPLNDYYWFMALPVFPDNFAPVISENVPASISLSGVYTLDLKDKATDQDNLNAAIVKSVSLVSGENIVTAEINGIDHLVITPLQQGVAVLKLVFNSNGKEISKNITVTNNTLATVNPTKSGLQIYPNPAKDIVTITAEKDADFKIYDTSGKLVKAGKTQNKTFSVNELNNGLYIVETTVNADVLRTKLLISK